MYRSRYALNQITTYLNFSQGSTYMYLMFCYFTESDPSEGDEGEMPDEADKPTQELERVLKTGNFVFCGEVVHCFVF